MKKYETIMLDIMLVLIFGVTAQSQAEEQLRKGYVVLKNFDELYEYLDKDNVKIKLPPGHLLHTCDLTRPKRLSNLPVMM